MVVEKGLGSASRDLAVLVMELADGSMQGKRFEGDAIVMVAWALASTLALLNAAGFIHGDLKPSNVLWQANSDSQTEPDGRAPSPGGWPLLTDFGSAQAFSSMHPQQKPLSLDDQIRTHGWTKEYAAPEVVSRSGKWQSIQSDMYSWAQTILSVSQHQALPAGLLELCAKCLDADPKMRPKSFAEIAETLEMLCPSCMAWGLALWKQQQACFESSAHANRHAAIVCKQGLEVLSSQRRHLSEDRISESNALELLALQHLSIGSAGHAVAMDQKAVKICPWRAVSASILKCLGAAYGELGDVSKKRDLLEKALRIQESYLGYKDHPDLAETLVNLGNAYGLLGDVSKQKGLLDKALRIQEAYFDDKDHPDLARTLVNLGNAYGELGDVSKQKDLLETALRIQEAYFGDKDHPGLVVTLDSLGNAYGHLGDVSKAKDLLEKALRIREAYFGYKAHPVLARTLMNLGAWNRVLGDVSKAKDLLEKALRIQEAYFGYKDHPDLAATLVNLGNAYGHLGDVSKKRDLLEKALRIQEAYFDNKDHPDLARTLVNLGNAYVELGDVSKQKDLLEKALRIQEAYFGDKDLPDMAATLNNLGNAYGRLGDDSKRKDLLEKALRIQEAYFGDKDHPDMANTLHSLGLTYGALGDVPQKRHLLERALKIQEACFGNKDHPEMASILRDLGNAYGELGDVSKQRDLLERALKIQEAHFGKKDHPTMANTLHSLGLAYGVLGDVPKQKDLLEKALRIQEACFGDKDQAMTMANLASGPLHLLEGWRTSREWCERAVVIFLKELGPEHPDTIKLQHHLEDVLQKYEAPKILLAVMLSFSRYCSGLLVSIVSLVLFLFAIDASISTDRHSLCLTVAGKRLAQALDLSHVQSPVRLKLVRANGIQAESNRRGEESGESKTQMEPSCQGCTRS